MARMVRPGAPWTAKESRTCTEGLKILTQPPCPPWKGGDEAIESPLERGGIAACPLLKVASRRAPLEPGIARCRFRRGRRAVPHSERSIARWRFRRGLRPVPVFEGDLAR